MADLDKFFAGSIPKIYEAYLGPLLFQPYADDMAERIAALAPKHILETAAGTGFVTLAVASRLPSAAITSTDLNQAMLDIASGKPGAEKITWQACDATRLPFADASFDVVVTQFGVMFFPDRLAGYREARRVLRPGGTFIFNVWDSIGKNPVTETVVEGVAEVFPEDPPSFLRRLPHGYFDVPAIVATLREAGFSDIRHETVTLPCTAPSAEWAAVGLCQGTPMRNEIETRDAKRLAAATEAARRKLEARYGRGEISGPMQAIVFSARL